MNGVRSIFRRKGYLLTALAAAVLLAASSGTAWAQLTEASVTLEAPPRVTEGSDVTITVRGKATVPMGTDSPQRVTVSLGFVPSSGSDSSPDVTAEFEEASQVDDATIVSNPTATLTFAANTGSTERERTATASVTVRTNHDEDAESEMVFLMATDTTDNVDVTFTNTAARVGFMIRDDDTQTYVLTLDPVTHATTPPKEGSPVMVKVAAKPGHYDNGKTLTLNVIQNGKRASGYSADGPDGNAWRVRVGNDTGEDADENPATAMENTRTITVGTPSDANGDGNRVTDTVTLEAHSGDAGSDKQEASLDIDVLDINMLPAADAITAVAKDADGKVVTEIMEGGDPVFLTLTVDRGRGEMDRITGEELTVDIRAADGAQVADYDLSETRVELEGVPSGKQTNDVDLEIKLSARSDEDVGMEYLMLNLEVSGDAKIGKETSTGTFSIGVVDNTMKKVEPKAEADAYPAILDALKAGSGDDGDFNPGETFSVMASDLFDVADGYTASYGISVEGGSVSVSASSDSITVTGTAAGESKVTITATAKMAASSFLPEQTMSDVAKITFAVMVVDEETEPVPALPLFGQLLLALFMMAGGARLYRRRQG